MMFLRLILEIGVELVDLYRVNTTQMDMVDCVCMVYTVYEVALNLSRLFKLVVNGSRRLFRIKNGPQKN